MAAAPTHIVAPHGAAVDCAEQATRDAHEVVTATTAPTPFLTRDMLRAGAFVAAVGADNPDKSELSPELMAQAKVVVDAIGQAATSGSTRSRKTSDWPSTRCASDEYRSAVIVTSR